MSTYTHHFRNICVDRTEYDAISSIDDFVRISKEQSQFQTFYNCPANDPDRGPNKYFGDALESLAEVFLSNTQLDKRINCVGYRPAKIDEFGIDGTAALTWDNQSYGKLAVQIKASASSKHTYSSSNSNILAAVAALKVFNYDRLLFINTGAGIHRDLLRILNQNDDKLVVELSRLDLSKLMDGNIALWNMWFKSLT